MVVLVPDETCKLLYHVAQSKVCERFGGETAIVQRAHSTHSLSYTSVIRWDSARVMMTRKSATSSR